MSGNSLLDRTNSSFTVIKIILGIAARILGGTAQLQLAVGTGTEYDGLAINGAISTIQCGLGVIRGYSPLVAIHGRSCGKCIIRQGHNRQHNGQHEQRQHNT